MTDDKLTCWIRAGTATAVFDFATIAQRLPQLMRMTCDGKRLFIS
jgi:hypothetical protein